MERFEHEPPGVMVIDIGMPVEDGFALLKRIRAYEAAHAKPAIPAIAVTAYAAPTHHDAALRAGFAAHLPKPVLPDQLLSAVRRTTGR